MSYPILKPNSSWFTPTVSTVKRSAITTINIVDSYTPSTTPTDSWDASVAQDGSIMCYVEGTTLTIAGNGSGKIMANEDSNAVFSDVGAKDYFTKLSIINGANIFDTSNATILTRMFNQCNALTYVDVSNWNISNVTSIRIMFQQCNKLETLDVSNWNTGNITDMGVLFSKCYLLNNIDVSNWNLSKVTDMKNMFRQCSALTSLDVSNWDVSSCKTMYGLFDSCTSLANLDVSNWDVSSVEDFTYAFYKCPITVLDVSNWNVSSGKVFNGMFENCESLGYVDVSKWNMSNATDISFMFYKMTPMTSINVSSWDVSNVENFDHMFAHCTNLADLDVSNWNVTNKCTNLSALFHSTDITSVNVSGWDTSNVIAMSQCFEATNLEKIIGLETWDTSNCICFSQMFSGSSYLKELDLSNFDTRKARADGKTQTSSNGSKCYCTSKMLNGLSRLEKLVLGENFTLLGDGTTTTADAIGSIPTPSSTYIEEADGNWYTRSGEVYAPSEVPNLVAETYFASKSVVTGEFLDGRGLSLFKDLITNYIDERDGVTLKSAKAYTDETSNNLNTLNDEFDDHVADTTAHMTSTQKTQLSTAYTHSQSAHARTDATNVAKSSNNGNILINGTETVVYTHPSGTNPHGTTKADVGLGNVDNTSDANKPVSTAQKAAIDAVQTNVNTVDDKVDDHIANTDIHFTAAERTKLAGIDTGANKYTHPTSGVTAGTYRSVTVNANGHVTGGSNPTTLAGYGITDAEAKGTVNTHNVATDAHNDIRLLISDVSTKLNNFLNVSDTTKDQLSEIIALIEENADDIESITSGKVNVSDIVNNLTTNVSNKPLSAAQGVAIKALIDSLQGSLETHVSNADVHFTTTERTKLSGIATGAEVNQNAFSNVKVGSTTVSADSKTDTIEFVGSNVTITPDATNDKITFTVANGTTSAVGIVKLTDSVSSTDTTTAATPNSVKSAYDLANVAKTAASTAQTTADSKSDKGHKHTVSEITDADSLATKEYVDSSFATVDYVDSKLQSNYDLWLSMGYEGTPNDFLEWLRGEGASLSQVDWNQDDETAPDYIKNRTHYDNRIFTLMYDKSYNATSLGSTDKYIAPFSRAVAIGENKTYSVRLNGVSYSCVAYRIDDAICLGNASLINAGETNTGEDFYVSYVNDPDGAYTDIILSADYVASHGQSGTVGITRIEGTLKKLDESFIPDDIARTESINSILGEIDVLRDQISLINDSIGAAIDELSKL